MLCLSFAPASDAEPVIEEVVVRDARINEQQSSPVLSYPRDYFVAFEPLTASDVLRRLPGVAFTGDAGEFGAPQLRGLESRYTQILVNGLPIPGSADDRSVQLDRIPSESIERIEILRSATARTYGEGIGGTINIILRDASTYQGGSVRLSGQAYKGEDVLSSFSANYGMAVADGQIAVSLLRQERLTPKDERAVISDADGVLLETANSRDNQRGREESATVSFSRALSESTTVTLHGQFGESDGGQDERFRIVNEVDGELETSQDLASSDQRRDLVSMNLNTRLANQAAVQLRLSTSGLDDDFLLTERTFDDGEPTPTLTQSVRVNDRRTNGEATFENSLGRHSLAVGGRLEYRSRNANSELAEFDDDEWTSQFESYGLRETLTAIFVEDEWLWSENTAMNLGLRVENAQLSLPNADSRNDTDLLPSAHWAHAANDTTFRLGVARTLRRPAFDERVPLIQLDTPDEGQRTVGNPQLQPESAWSYDIGVERYFSEALTTVGLNIFYRDVADRIELQEVAPDLFRPINTGSGWAAGAELDVQVSDRLLSVPGLSMSAHWTWLQSETDDPYTGESIRFNLQPRSIGTLDVSYRPPQSSWAFGLEARSQGRADTRELDEIGHIDYGTWLSAHIEKRLGESWRVRAAFINLLEQDKAENAVAFDGLQALIDNDPALRVIERERSQASLMLTLRGSF